MSYADLTPVSREPMRPPATARVFLGSILAGLAFNLLPWSAELVLFRPNLLLLVIVYWVVNEPRLMGQGLAFILALIMDVADSMLLGQQALAYAVAVYLAQVLRLRILQLTWAEQALHVAGILVASTLVTLLLNAMLGRVFPGLWVFASPVLAALTWPLVHAITGMPRFGRPPPTTMMR